MGSDMIEQHYSSADLCALLGCSEDAIYAAAHKGELKGVRVGNRWRFPESSVEDYLNRRRKRDDASNIVPFIRPNRRRGM